MKLSLLKRIEFSPFLAQLVITRRCNLRCGYCNEFDRISPPVDEGILMERMDKLKALGTFSLELTGGEPLLHPGIFRLLAHAKGLGFVTRWMITNGYLLTREKIEALNSVFLTDMQISVDGVEPNRTTVKVLKPLRKKLEMLSRHARFRVSMSAVIGAAPPEEVREVIEFAVDHGFRPRVLLLHDGSGVLKLSEEEKQLYRDLQTYLGRQAKEAGNYRNKLLDGGSAPFKCRAGSRYLYVDEFGYVHWCSQTMKKFQKALDSYSLEDLKEQFYTNKPCNPYCTLGCARTNSRLDWWRKQNHTETD